MKQIYFHSKAEHIDLHDTENSDESKSEPESAPKPCIVKPNAVLKNIFDLKSQSSHLPTDKLIDLLRVNSNEKEEKISYHREFNKHYKSKDKEQNPFKSRYARVSSKLRREVIDLINWKKMTRAAIAHQLFIPYSTVCRIVRENEIKTEAQSNLTNDSCLNLRIDSIAKYHAAEFIKSSTSPFTSINVQSYLFQILKRKYSQRSIIEFMKLELGLSYKKISSRPVLKDAERTQALKTLFCIEFSNLINQTGVIINIDELLFSKHTKEDYSWSIIGISRSMNNICFSHSLTLICAITTNGDCFATNLNNTNNSEKFIDFIDNLSKWIKEDLQYEMLQITLLMDNSSIHKAKRCLDYMNKLGCKVVFLSPYSQSSPPLSFVSTL